MTPWNVLWQQACLSQPCHLSWRLFCFVSEHLLHWSRTAEVSLLQSCILQESQNDRVHAPAVIVSLLHFLAGMWSWSRGLGLETVFRRTLLPFRFGLVLDKILNVLVLSRSRTCAFRVSSRSRLKRSCAHPAFQQDKTLAHKDREMVARNLRTLDFIPYAPSYFW